jgi:hypothetical protein
MTTMKMQKIVCALAIAGVSSVATAQMAGIMDFSGGTAFDSYYGSLEGDVIGWTFEVNENIIVTDLGMWIDDGGMQSIHEVGIWDINGNLLVDTVVDPNTAFEFNGFNYQEITPYALSAGEQYVIGGMVRSGDDDSYISGASTADVAPEITWLNSRFPLEGELGFVFPEETSASIGRFGPNFLLSDIPGPGGLALLGLGLLGYRRRR